MKNTQNTPVELPAHSYNVPHLFYSETPEDWHPSVAGEWSVGVEIGGWGSNLFQKQPRELLSAIIDSEAIGGINHPDESIGLFKVIFPI